MTQERWTEVDRYLAESLVRADPSLDAAIKTSRASGLPSWDVSPTQGKLLYLIARLGAGARSILEIGTLGGDSTIWLAKALPLPRAGRCKRAAARRAPSATSPTCDTPA